MSDQTTEITPKTGGCYCGALRYALSAAPIVKGQCHCSACQHIAGGAPQYFVLIPSDGFKWTKGMAQTFAHPHVKEAVTRSFCPTCGTHIMTQRRDQTALVIKVGTLDDPSRFRPHIAICHAQAPDFHMVPADVPVFEDLPPRR